MNTTLALLFATIAIPFTAAAAPAELVVQITLSERLAEGDKMLARPTLYMKSGAQLISQLGAFSCAFTSTLREDDTVTVSAVPSETVGQKVQEFPVLETKTELGKVAKVQSDRFVLETKVTLAK